MKMAEYGDDDDLCWTNLLEDIEIIQKRQQNIESKKTILHEESKDSSKKPDHINEYLE
jgi:hypothetical protein